MPATCPSPPSAFGARGERVRVRGGYLLECRQATWLTCAVGSWRRSKRPPLTLGRRERRPLPSPPNWRGRGSTSPPPSSSGLARGPMVPRATGQRPSAAVQRALIASAIDAARWVLGTRPRMTPVLSPPLPSKRISRAGGEGQGEGPLLAQRHNNPIRDCRMKSEQAAAPLPPNLRRICPTRRSVFESQPVTAIRV